MPTFETLQLNGLQPSLIVNKLAIPSEALRRLMAKIELQENGCWKWTAAMVRDGYGVIRVSRTPSIRVRSHRLCYELVYGKIPEGMQIHHKTEDGCMGPSCVNPLHMMVVTPAYHAVHLSIGSASNVAAHRDCCAAGHPYTLETLRMTPEGTRRCRVCERKYAVDAYWKKRGDPINRVHKSTAPPKRTHCIRGHELTPENSYYQGTDRSCLTCRREYRKRKIAVEAPISPQNDLIHQNP